MWDSDFEILNDQNLDFWFLDFEIFEDEDLDFGFWILRLDDRNFRCLRCGI